MSDPSDLVSELERLFELERSGESTELSRDLVESARREIDQAAESDQGLAADLAFRVADVAIWMMENGRWL